jgi:hypothetical protein
MAAMGEGGGRRLKRLKINGERESKGEKEGNAGKSIFVAESTRKRERKRERERERERERTHGSSSRRRRRRRRVGYSLSKKYADTHVFWKEKERQRENG